MTSLHDQTIQPSIKYLTKLSSQLTKAERFADEKGMKHEEIINHRLYPDMKSFAFQVQSCCNTAKFLRSRLGGYEDIYFADDETTFEQLQNRIDGTIQLLRDTTPESMNGKVHEPLLIVTKSNGKFQFETGGKYVNEYAMPNFHFHFSTAYCILRHLGVPIGALDYLGGDTFVRPADETSEKQM